MQFADLLRNFMKQAVLDGECSGRASGLNGKELMDISDCVLRSSSKYLRKLAQDNDVGFATAHKAV
jgi:hypothetical protein